MGRVSERITAVVTVLVTALALAACGSGTSTKDKNAYAEKVNAAQLKFGSTVATVESQSGSANGIAQQQRTLRRFKRAIDGVVADLGRIDAPPEVAKEHERLVAVMTGFGRDIGKASDAMRNPTPRVMTDAKLRIRTASVSVVTRVNAATTAINLKLRGK